MAYLFNGAGSSAWRAVGVMVVLFCEVRWKIDMPSGGQNPALSLPGRKR